MKDNQQNYINMRDKALSLAFNNQKNRDIAAIHSSDYTNSLLNNILLKIEYFYTYFTLLFFTDALAFRSFFLSGEGSADYVTPLDPIMGLLRYSIYTFTVCIILIRFKLIFPVLLRAKSISILTLLCYFSYYWSDFPDFTTRYASFVVGTTLFGIYFAGRYDFREKIQFLAWVFGTIVIMCFLFTLLLPGAGIEQGMHSGAWRGIFWHKNNLGRYATLGAVLFALMAKSSNHYKKLLWGLCSLSVVLLILSNSKTALVIFLISIVLFYFCYVLSWDSIISVPIFLSAFLAGCGVTFWAVQSLEKVLLALGKGVTLSGRTDIWNAVIPHIWLKPYLGYGYWSFWLVEGQGRYVRAKIGFDAAHAHNGFLDLILELGFIGLGLFLISYIIVFAQSLRLVGKAKSFIEFWPILFLSFFLMYNFSTSQVLQDNDLTWMIYVTLAYSMEDLLKDNAETSQQLVESEV